MPWLIWQLASGRAFIAGVAMLALCVAFRPVSNRRIFRFSVTVGSLIATVLIAISAVALPAWVYVIWAAMMLCWLVAAERRFWRWSAVAARAMLLGVTALAVAVELPRELRPSIPNGIFRRVYVIGDSISAGLGNKAIDTWPDLLRSEHGIDVVNLSRAGAGVSQARRVARNAQIDDGMVILEIGGNDVIGSEDPKTFDSDLNALCASLSRQDRKLVMLELPLLPFGNAYGRAQRRIADQYQITLIPRRYFASILSSPGATLDGLHLTAVGQQRMAAMLWDLLGRSMALPLSNRDSGEFR
jgi:lysophospholipase L1-like esterase